MFFEEWLNIFDLDTDFRYSIKGLLIYYGAALLDAERL